MASTNSSQRFVDSQEELELFSLSHHRVGTKVVHKIHDTHQVTDSLVTVSEDTEVWLNGSLVPLVNRIPLDKDPKRLTSFPAPGEGRQRLFPVLKPNPGDEEEDKAPQFELDLLDHDHDQGPVFNPEKKDFWMPDRMCKMCNGCELAFTMFKRRHHCRFCGRVFCNGCSSFFVHIEEKQGFLRACKLCRDQVQAARNSQQSATTSPVSSSSRKSVPKRNTATATTKKTALNPLPSRAADQKSALTLKNKQPHSASDLAGLGVKKAGVEPQLHRASSQTTMGEDPITLLERGIEREMSRDVGIFNPEGEWRSGDLSGLQKDLMEAEKRAPEQEAAEKVMAMPIYELNDLQILSAEEHQEDSEYRRILESAALIHLERIVFHYLYKSPLLSPTQAEQWAPTVVALCQQVCANVDPNVRGGDLLDIRPFVKIKRIPGGDLSESCYLDGLVFRKTPVQKAMAKRRLDQLRVLLLSGSIEFQRQGSRIAYFDTLVEQEEHYMKILVDKILVLKPQLLLVGGSVSRAAQQLLAENGIVIVQHIKQKLMERIARCVGAQILPSTDQVVNYGQKALGYANEFFIQGFYSPELEQRVKNVRAGAAGKEAAHMSEAEMVKRMFGRVRGNGSVFYSYLIGLPRHLGCTVLLRGASSEILREVKRITRYCLNVAYNLRLEVSFLHDRGATFPFAVPTQEEQQIFLNSDSRVLSSSMEVRFGSPPPQPSHPVETNLGESSSSAEHFDLLMTSIFMYKTHQCIPAEIKGIIYYTYTQDVTLGQFLLDSCFNLGTRCPHMNCKRPVTDHVHTLVHRDGEVSISFFAVDDPYKNSDQYEREQEEFRLNDESSRRARSYARPIRMWSYCVKCNKVVGHPVVMSGDTWKFSFGKFMEVYFYNQTAVGLEPTCRHSVQSDLMLFFGCDGLVAQFKYKRIRPYKVYVRRQLPFSQSWHSVEVQKLVLGTVQMTSPIFEIFLGRIHEFAQAVQESQLKSYEKKSLNRELLDLQREVATVSMLFFNQMPSLLTHKEIYTEMTFMKTRMLNILDEADWVSHLDQWWECYQSWAFREIHLGPTNKSNNKILLRFPHVLRRKLYFVMQNWNDRLATAGHILQVLERNKGNESRINMVKDDFERMQTLKTGGKRIRKNQRKKEENVSDSEPDDEDDVLVREKPKRLGDDRVTRDRMRARDQLVVELLRDIVYMAVAESEGDVKYIVKATLRSMVFKIQEKFLVQAESLERSPVTPTKNGQSKLLPKRAKKRDDFMRPENNNQDFLKNQKNKMLSSLEFMKLEPAFVEAFEHAMEGAEQCVSQYGVKEAELRCIEDIPLDIKEAKPVKKNRKMRRPADSSEEELGLVEEVMIPDDNPKFESSNDPDPASFTRKEDQYPRGKKSAAVKFQNALARFMGKDIVEEIDWAVPLHHLQEGKLGLEPGVNGEVTLVLEDQPMSIIAYSLLSKEYAGVMNEFRCRSMTEQLKFNNEDERKKMCELQERVFSGKKSYTKNELETMMLYQSKTDFKHRFSEMDEKGNTTVKFICHSYCALQFHALRSQYCDEGLISDENFVHSLCTARSWDARGGKSGARFFMTSDSRFIVKFVSRTELQMFVDVAPFYFEYMAQVLFRGTNSVLVKILGVYDIGYHNRINGKRYMEQVVVMQNLFYGRRTAKIFDLKGSKGSRYVNVKENDPQNESSESSSVNDSKPQSQQVLLDENLAEWTHGHPIPLQDQSMKVFKASTNNDSIFLSFINVVDYSILVGIDEDNHELVVGIIDYMRQYDIIKKMERVGKSVGMIAGQAEPTIIQPPSYKARFLMAMDRYFMSVPDKWTTVPSAEK